jgi:hypothetical protein
MRCSSPGRFLHLSLPPCLLSPSHGVKPLLPCFSSSQLPPPASLRVPAAPSHGRRSLPLLPAEPSLSWSPSPAHRAQLGFLLPGARLQRAHLPKLVGTLLCWSTSCVVHSSLAKLHLPKSCPGSSFLPASQLMAPLLFSLSSMATSCRGPCCSWFAGARTSPSTSLFVPSPSRQTACLCPATVCGVAHRSSSLLVHVARPVCTRCSLLASVQNCAMSCTELCIRASSNISCVTRPSTSCSALGLSVARLLAQPSARLKPRRRLSAPRAYLLLRTSPHTLPYHTCALSSSSSYRASSRNPESG